MQLVKMTSVKLPYEAHVAPELLDVVPMQYRTEQSLNVDEAHEVYAAVKLNLH
jgi:hypothetical protein